MAEIKVKQVKDKRELKTFIYLPEKIHKGHKNWVPPVYLDESSYFNPAKNKAFEYCETILAIAYIDNKPVGRIMGIIHNRYNQIQNVKNARFCFPETYNDPNIIVELLCYIESWAREKGMTKLVGPLAFSDKDPQGLIIEGFDEEVVISTACNWPWMPEYN